nr:envelope glycoprotein N UL49.5 [Psittacid alphaherpesvirus 6]
MDLGTSKMITTVVLCAIICTIVADTGVGSFSAFGQGSGNDFWSPVCSAIGVSVAFSSAFSVLFYLGLIVVLCGLLTGSYQACFKLFTKDMFKYDW